MTYEKDTGGLAFPIGSGDMRDPMGMSLRDYFAAKAMQGELAAMTSTNGLVMIIADDSLGDLATHWYRIADAMLKERAK